MKGLILIPDITGFTNFVKGIDPNLGVSITRELLCEIIDNNKLGLELSEIEGDAVLFYKVGQPMPLDEVFAGLNTMYSAFCKKYESFRAKHGINSELSLKFILHYGEMTIFQIRGFKKLYGQTIIESHRLLKNGSVSTSYILITDDYIGALNDSKLDCVPCKGNFPASYSQWFIGLREISYYFFHYPSHGQVALQYSFNN